MLKEFIKWIVLIRPGYLSDPSDGRQNIRPSHIFLTSIVNEIINDV